MTIEGSRKINFGLKIETREIPSGEGVTLDDRGIMTIHSFRVADVNTVSMGVHVIHLGGRTTRVLKGEEINAAKLKSARPLSLQDRLLGRGHEIYRWRP